MVSTPGSLGETGAPAAGDDVIGSLASRVRELALEVARLDGELQAARRRIAVLEAGTRPAVEPAAKTIDGAVTEWQLVLSPVPSFPLLVELERRIQSIAFVRTLYIRDFRNGIATLALGMRSALTADDLLGALGDVGYPGLRLLSRKRNTLELRIDAAGAV